MISWATDFSAQSHALNKIGGYRAPGTPKGLRKGFLAAQVNDPSLKSPIASLGSDKYKIYRFFSLQGIYRAYIR